MAIFSNLSGTMQKSFVLGKNGSRLTYNDTQNTIRVQNYQGTRLINLSVADPIEPSHAVTLGYFNTHSGGESVNPIMRGRTEPDLSLGSDGDVYFQIDDSNIVQIYIKDNSKWKPFKEPAPVLDSNYVTTTLLLPSMFVFENNRWSYILRENVHNRGADILVQVQDSSGNNEQPNITIDNAGNIQVTCSNMPTDNVIINLIGKTTMTVPYSNNINKSQWAKRNDMYTLTIPSSAHKQQPGPLYLAIYENVTDSATSQSPYTLVTTENNIDTIGNVTFSSYTPFSGKVVISGK